jgi:menaquinone-specific isochorismate synthase
MNRPVNRPHVFARGKASCYADLPDHFEVFLSSGAIISGKDRDLFWIGWGAHSWRSEPDARLLSFFAPDYFLRAKNPWLVFEFSREVSRETLLSWIDPYFSRLSSKAPQIGKWKEPSFESFGKDFSRIQLEIGKETFKKAVPVVFATAEFSFMPDFLVNCLQNSLQAPRTLFPYGFWIRDEKGKSEGCLGATPEVLFHLNEKTLETAAIAGTAKIEQDDSLFLSDPKERFEHQVVIDDIVSRLSPLGEVSCGETGILKLPNLSHLMTPIQVALSSSCDFEKQARDLHPTPALGIFPRHPELLEMLEAKEDVKRERFGAPFGAKWESKPTLCLVAIRNIQWHGERLSLGSGCGIVSQSDLESEWQELARKRKVTREVLGI